MRYNLSLAFIYAIIDLMLQFDLHRTKFPKIINDKDSKQVSISLRGKISGTKFRLRRYNIRESDPFFATLF